jgi:hypothetical protein
MPETDYSCITIHSRPAVASAASTLQLVGGLDCVNGAGSSQHPLDFSHSKSRVAYRLPLVRELHEGRQYPVVIPRMDSRSDGDLRLALLTLVLCSRNDRHAGNSVWRLETTLNYVAHQLESLGCESDLEVIVADWGSETALREVLHLSPIAARITRFLEVSPRLAAELQQDSPFAEVLANNAAVRRASGAFIGRIDQDTLVGASFLDRFLSGLRESASARQRWSEQFLFVGRRSIPEAFARTTPAFADIVRYVERFGRHLPREGRLQSPWFDAPVGIVIFSRALWEEYRAYDERLIYWGFMEADLGLRAAMTRGVYDLEREIGLDFHHLSHSRAWFAPTQRIMNLRREPSVEVPNDADWGLASIDLPLQRATSAASLDPVGSTVGGAGVAGVAAEWGRQSLLAAARVGRRLVMGSRVEGAQ